MLTRLRAVLAVVMLAGFYVFAAGIVAALGGTTLWIWRNHPGAVALKLSVVTFAVGSAVVVAMVRAAQARPGPPPGRRVDPEQAPELWQVVRELAGVAGTTPPQELYLVGEVNAAVSEDSRLMGLIGGTRRLFLGVPLLIGLDVAQLRSVLAHELGHYSGRHTRLGAIDYRGRLAIIGTLARLQGRFTGWVLGLYARLYFLVEAAVSRRQELEADRAAVAAVGADAARSALREVPVLDAAWDFYLERYVAPAWEDGVAPEDLFGGFAELLAARTEELDRIRAGQPPGRRSRWDSHPPIAARITAMEGMPGPGAAADERPGSTLLPDFRQVCLDLAAERAAAQGKTLTPWAELTATAVQAGEQRLADRIYRTVARVAGTPAADLEALLALLAAGRAEELIRALAPKTTGEEASGQAVAAVELLLRVAAVRSGKAVWRHSWSGPAELVRADGSPLDLGPAATALLRADGLAPGRELLAAEGIDLAQGQQVERTVSARGAGVLGGLANMKVDGQGRDVLILTNGLVLAPCPKSSQGGKQRLAELAGTDPVQLAARHGLLAFEQIAGARLLKRTPVGLELRLHDGRTLTLQEAWTGDRLTKGSSDLLAGLAELHAEKS